MSSHDIYAYSIILQIIYCPLTSVLIVAIVYFYARISILGLSTRSYSLSINDIIAYSPTDIDSITPTTNPPHNTPLPNPYYRIFTSQFIHTNLIHLLFDIITLWEIRKIEFHYGSFFFFKYSLFLTLLLSITAIAYQYLFVHYIGPRFRLNVDYLLNIEHIGCSGFVCGWISYQSLQNFEPAIYLFGFLGFSPTLAPVIITMAAQVIMPRVNALQASSGLLAGYFILLYPLYTLYWSCCFLLDVLLLLAWKSPVIPLFANLHNAAAGAAGQGNETSSHGSAGGSVPNYESIAPRGPAAV